MSENNHTPAAAWRESGEPDPHGTNYDCDRHQLSMGNLTDDELANGAFLNYDRPLNVAGILAGTHASPIMWMTAVKDRIRWLSRRLCKVEKQRDELLAALEGFGHKLGCKKNAFGDECTCGVDAYIASVKATCGAQAETAKIDPASLLPNERECCGTFPRTPHRSTCAKYRGKKGGAA